MLTQKFIKIFHSDQEDQEIGLFSLFQNLNLGNALANPKWHLTISWAISCQYQCICNILSKYPKRFKSYRHFSRTGRRHFHFFRIWTLATPRPIPNNIWQSLGLHLVNINAYAKFYQNTPNGLRVIDNFRPASKSSQTVWWQNQMFDYRALLEIQLSVDFLRVMQSSTLNFPSFFFK